MWLEAEFKPVEYDFTITVKGHKKGEYPLLKRGVISGKTHDVLFTAQDTGFLVSESNSVEFFSSLWEEELFEEISGPVVLKNTIQAA
jgi:hypothetical protein